MATPDTTISREYAREYESANRVCQKALQKNSKARFCTEDCPFAVCIEDSPVTNRRIIARRLSRDGVSIQVIAANLNVSVRTIRRIIY